MAMVLDVNKLYVNNGQGWYFISIINTSPSITGGIDPNYDLDITGVPTVITVIADDPEGVPLTYTHSAPTLGNTAVITQNNNIFTVTPSTLESNAGAFDITITASDGINIAAQTAYMSLIFGLPASGVLFTTVGTHVWTVPGGVSSVSVVVIGGGGGKGGYNGGSSYFGDYVIAPTGYSGNNKSDAPSGTGLTDGYRGGAGAGGGGPNGSGGGTAGYTQDGGNGSPTYGGGHIGGGVAPYGGSLGGTGGGNSPGTPGSGGSGGTYGGGAGTGDGGVSTSGSAGSLGYGNDISVIPGQQITVKVSGGNGPSYQPGAQGVVRVIWGDSTVTRTFPSTNVDAASSSVTETTV
jgi:hypothetical protein